MAKHIVHRLTAAAVKSAGKGMHADGAGLYLRVVETEDGEKRRSWIYRYAVAETLISKTGKPRQRERQMGLGACNASTLSSAASSLALARKLATKAYESRRLGEDPIDQRAKARKVVVNITTNKVTPTFDEMADRYIANHERGWKSDHHRSQWIGSLVNYVSPVIGSKPVDAITTEDVANVLDPIWPRIPETASRIRGRIETVLDFAGMNGNNPARWQGNLEHRYPKRNKKRAGHHAALPYEQTAEFMTKLRDDPAPPLASWSSSP